MTRHLTDWSCPLAESLSVSTCWVVVRYSVSDRRFKILLKQLFAQPVNIIEFIERERAAILALPEYASVALDPRSHSESYTRSLVRRLELVTPEHIVKICSQDERDCIGGFLRVDTDTGAVADFKMTDFI